MEKRTVKKWRVTAAHFQKGFTLVEIILVIALTAILFSITSLVLVQGLDSYAHISKRTPHLQVARYAFERMSRELRRAGDDAGSRIQNIGPTRIDFVDDQAINTSFHLQGQILFRGADRLLNNVTALTFTGYKDDNSVTTAAPQVRRVRIDLTTLPQGQVSPLRLQTDVFVRNYLYENFQ